MKSKKAIVLLSGGMDSAVALWWAVRNGWRCRAVCFDYGQRHRKELSHAARLAKSARVPLERIQFRLPWSTSSLTDRTHRLPHHPLPRIGKKSLPTTYVPARNTIFLSFALSLADQTAADAIVIGANAVDYSGYPDCRPRYLRAFEKAASLGSGVAFRHRKIRVLAPLVQLSKAQIVVLGRRLKVPFDLTWSCYRGGRVPCGRCDSCQLREKGFREASV